ncbi:MAG: hypothetical protein LCH52_08415 [Bacteroidetes bacterium]|nr:hypothetical protein [Bacteroidota bacterium]
MNIKGIERLEKHITELEGQKSNSLLMKSKINILRRLATNLKEADPKELLECFNNFFGDYQRLPPQLTSNLGIKEIKSEARNLLESDRYREIQKSRTLKGTKNER